MSKKKKKSTYGSFRRTHIIGIEELWRRVEDTIPKDWRIIGIHRHFGDANESMWTVEFGSVKNLELSTSWAGFWPTIRIETSGRNPVEAMNGIHLELSKLKPLSNPEEE